MAQKAQIDLLIKLYHEAQLRLIRIITSGTGAGTKTYYNTVLKQLEQLMKQLRTETGRYIDTAIPEEYKEALDETYEYFRRNNLTMKRPDMFARIHADAVHELSREMRYHITQGISIAGRRVMRYLDESRDNILRQQGLRASAVKIASGQTVHDMQKDLMQRLANEGFLTVQYGSEKGAYQVGLDAYAAMVARSTTREAGNLARENQLADNGYDLMQMTEHYPTCVVCAQLQGRVYSISGKDKRFPPLSRAFQSGYRNVHPNCRHVMTYFVEEMQTPEEMDAAIRKSNKPFEDNRSADEKALYSQQQADNRRMRADRSQFERCRARLGNEAPKTFSQFRKLKKQGGKKWDEMQKLYRGKFLKTVDNSKKSGIINKKVSDRIINLFNESDNNLFIFEDIEAELLNSNVGRGVSEFIESENLYVTMNYDFDAPPDLMGDVLGNNITVYAVNHNSLQEVAETIIHEAAHKKYSWDKDQEGEINCRLLEYFHSHDAITDEQISEIVNFVKREYDYLPEGELYGY